VLYPAGVLTQKDIARRLGVSQALVSRALAGTAGDIGAAPATIERIRKAAAQLNYRPSAAALTLRGTPTRTLGVVIKDFDDPFFGHLIGTLQGLALRRDHSLMLTGAAADRPSDELSALLKHQVEGLFVVGSDFAPPGLASFLQQGVPVVLIGSGTRIPGASRVTMDEEHGLHKLVQYLKRLGHRRLGLLGNQTAPNLRRQALVKTLLRQAGLPLQARWIVTPPLTAPEAGYQGMQRLLLNGPDRQPTAIIAMEDVMAQTALRALFEAGLQAPKDISISGIDDIPAAAMTIPALTTIRQPMQKMVETAFELLLRPAGKRAAGKEQQVVIQPELIIRESCGPAATEST
jgi:DNA-binding LacI/PurR family transcriptional regulator